ncbi:MAG TPA: ABC transporter ATP-binding protein [Bacilli bacterium]|nr:ABC transporter ATP-binding protein [Bacilli bacterium]
MRGFKKLLKWSKPYLFLLLVVVLLTVVNPLAYSFVPQFIKYIVDVILGGASSATGTITLPSFLMEFFDSYQEPLTAITIVGIALVLWQLLRGIIMFFNGYVKGVIGEGIAFDMRTRLYSHIQDLSYTYQNNADTGDLIQRCTSDVDTIKSFLTSQLPQVLYIIASFTAGAIQMYFINRTIMLVTLGVVPISLVSSVIYFRYVRKKFEEIEVVEANMTTVLQENINGVRVVKAFAREKHEITKFNEKNAVYRDESRKLNNAMGFYWGASDFITMLQYAATIGVCVYLAKNGLVSTGDIIACMMYIGMLVYPIRGLGRIIGDFGKSTVAAKRLDEILAEPTEYVNDGILEPEINGNIKFTDVSFKFDDTDQHLLKNINFEIKAGETVAIIGKTGSGKSTIANMLVRMLDYDQGSITINGVELKAIKKHWVRSNIGIILQDPFLYAKSVLDNIKIGDRHLENEKVYQAAVTAAVDKDISGFASGYDTLVGEKGVTLSGGQKQRIAIARMLILNKSVLVFDDSLSAVDTRTDLMIRNALKLKDKGLTSIIITHRITTAKEANKIIVLENGGVSEIGTHQELAVKEGLYKRLWDIQGALENEFLGIVAGGESNE